MKTPSTSFFAEITNAYMLRLTEEVKETIAVESFEKQDRVFCAADIWNIQRRKRARVQRRFTL